MGELDFSSIAPGLKHFKRNRPTTGVPQNGLPERSKKPTVSPYISLRKTGITYFLLDVATKFGLIGPIAEQCEHKSVNVTLLHDTDFDFPILQYVPPRASRERIRVSYNLFDL